ncbi:hypothetical protein MKEN_00758600 [Mycena kentingensis (nom. inval.)]|nr:hypothetical protein MKEN_00758600 [Mycena kentingensis (nom. inval.)]
MRFSLAVVTLFAISTSVLGSALPASNTVPRALAPRASPAVYRDYYIPPALCPTTPTSLWWINFYEFVTWGSYSFAFCRYNSGDQCYYNIATGKLMTGVTGTGIPGGGKSTRDCRGDMYSRENYCGWRCYSKNNAGQALTDFLPLECRYSSQSGSAPSVSCQYDGNGLILANQPEPCTERMASSCPGAINPRGVAGRSYKRVDNLTAMLARKATKLQPNGLPVPPAAAPAA